MHVDAEARGAEERGIIGGSARILGELLRTPRVVKGARIVLSHLDPQAAPELVRTALYADSMLLLDVVSASPALANAAFLGIRELCRQVLALPETLVQQVLPRLLGELDAEPLGEAVGLTVGALGRLVPPEGDALVPAARRLEADFKRGLTAGLSGEAEAVDRQVAWLAETIRRLARENPAVISRVVRPLVQACREALEEGGDA